MASAERAADALAMEAAALGAVTVFSSGSVGMSATFRRAAHHAGPPRGDQIVLGLRAFVHGLADVGMQGVTSKAPPNNAATWTMEWLLPLGPPAEAAAGATASAFAPDDAVVASASLLATGRRAADFARQTVGRDLASLRHMVAAFLTLPEDRVRATLGRVGGEAWAGADLGGLRRHIFDRLSASPDEGERLDAWRAILGLDGGRAFGPPEVPRFASDRAGSGDRDALGVRRDAEAFAQLICRTDVTPLSIGLFGGWGSGKSTFMAMIEQEVEAFAARELARRKTRAPGTPAPFSGAIVQVRFNAWHYADANLWASLTAEFFDQMRAGGWRGAGRAIHGALVEKVNAHVHRLAGEAEAARAAVGVSSDEVRAALQQRADAAAAVGRAGSDTLRQYVLDQMTDAFAARKADAARLGGEEGMAGFLALAGQLRSFGGKLRATGAFVRSDPGPALFALAAGVAVAAAVGFFALGERLSAFASLATTLVALWAAIEPARKAIERILDSTAGFAGALDAASRERVAKLAEAEERLRAAQAEAAARQAAADRAARALARYVDPAAKAGNPPRLLRYMLEDDPDARALEREVGLISRTRRLFQALDEIVRESAPRDPDMPERIVIYIDDLDRCTPPQVYSVLQAVHLLLAFELFVVVVGVDVDWVQKSLAQEIRLRSADRPHLAAQYLEKIFQLPYWLRPLGAGEGGSYGGYVRDLLAADVAAPPDATPPEAGAPAAPPVGTAPVSGSAPPAAGEAQDEDVPDEDAVDMTLSEAERDFLASPELAAIAPSSPRAVKRMINTYRVIRAGLAPDRRAALLGEHGRPPAYPVVAVLLALECGPDDEGMHKLLRRLKADGQIQDGAGEARPGLAGALEATRRISAGVWADIEDVGAWAETIDRFSFHPPPAPAGAQEA